jgi:hypothetical protein
VLLTGITTRNGCAPRGWLPVGSVILCRSECRPSSSKAEAVKARGWDVDGADLDEASDIQLRRSDQIQALTEPELLRLDLDDLLVELLDRVRHILDADTAALLLLDEGAGQLVARAARGIEEELYQDVRIPLRQGFAGRIAAERCPVLLDRIDQTTVANGPFSACSMWGG